MLHDTPMRRLFDPAQRGYAPIYRGAGTACPGCGRTHWLVGRVMAECAFCAAALPIAQDGRS